MHIIFVYGNDDLEKTGNNTFSSLYITVLSLKKRAHLDLATLNIFSVINIDFFTELLENNLTIR